MRTADACPPALLISDTVSPSLSTLRAATITDAPAWARAIAKCLPRPLDAPVTNARRPFRLKRSMMFMWCLRLLSSVLQAVLERAFENALGHAPAMHFGRAVVDTERAHVREDSRDHRLVRHAFAAEDLHAPI